MELILLLFSEPFQFFLYILFYKDTKQSLQTQWDLTKALYNGKNISLFKFMNVLLIITSI